jgi:simple sugar transport system substrate-binding protein
MRESNSPWKVSVAVDPKLIGATNVRLVANKIAGEQTLRPTTLKPPPFHRRCWRRSRGGERGITGENHPGWGQTEDFIAPWFATLEAKAK